MLNSLMQLGWLPEADEDIHYELQVSGKTYAIHAAYTQRGFLCWQIFESTVTQFEVIYKLRDVLPARSFAILDNASNPKKHTEFMLHWEAVFHGAFAHSPEYALF